MESGPHLEKPIGYETILGRTEVTSHSFSHVLPLKSLYTAREI